MKLGDYIESIKYDVDGNEKLSYSGKIIGFGVGWICIEAIFDTYDRLELGYITFVHGDIFTEWYYEDKWYNIFRIHDPNSEDVKGWYCNFTRPPDISEDAIRFVDLALDIFVQPDGEILLLDEDDLDALDIPMTEVQSVWKAVDEIREMVKQREGPFAELEDGFPYS